MNADRDYREEGTAKEALNEWIPFMPFERLRKAFDIPVLGQSKGLS